MTDTSSVSDCPLISTARAEENIVNAITLFVGQGRKFSYADAEEATGIKSGTLYSYVRENDRRHIPAAELIRLCQFLGPVFTAKILSGTGQGSHYLEPQPGEPGYVIAKLAKGTGEFAWRGADHRYCNVDKGALGPVADEMIQILQPFSSGGGK